MIEIEQQLIKIYGLNYVSTGVNFVSVGINHILLI
jgi:hypothetical protein